MAQQKNAKLIESERFGKDTRLLSFSMETELGFRGGQYIIVDTGILLPGNKVAKRAYSILSSDDIQNGFQVAVKRIGNGPGSNFMHHLELGDELKFSGPWGKLVADGNSGETFVFATDTGITAALGLLNGNAIAPLRGDSKLIWFAESANYFLPFDFLMARLDQIGMRNLAMHEAPAIKASARAAKAIEIVDILLARALPKAAFLAGDGAVIYPVRDHLLRAGLAGDDIRLECFFNNPERKVPA
ncbi:MAG TPA: FAD-dependent oxidoreductase [Candidatus Binataceae bacterium]|nr:FAD-dependent oxidoreductase [Candidatus Binataceae bacterium]